MKRTCSTAIRWASIHCHIPQKHAAAINRFYEEALYPYLNFHRPCYFAVDTMDARGRIRETYPTEMIMTPWARLHSISHFEQYRSPQRDCYGHDGFTGRPAASGHAPQPDCFVPSQTGLRGGWWLR
ncbi:hypothetical protein ParKJ_38085 [Paraburkholderia fungorum]|uniref:Uncharacterized protein n=1 Tax=Paraburkholderia fungorum TaxID=134537 RepID=A0AAP5QJ92_9BURK|nr:hypothetical protein [Paraburkholderia fungorum]MDT8843247.1 hypothetical protein [Paraburkholderia fungorum]